MKLKTLKTRLSNSSSRINNHNAKRFIDSTISKFNESNKSLICDYPGEVFNFGWCEVGVHDLEDGRLVETIRISLP